MMLTSQYSDIALSVKGLSKAFGSTQALAAVDLDINVGQVLCLVGENGAGKSTLAKIVAGVETPDNGEIVIGGRHYSRLTPREAMGLGVAIVAQETDVLPGLSVAENVFLGDAPTRAGLIDWASMRRQTGDLANRLHIRVDAQALVETLSPAEKQQVQILRALRQSMKVVVFDEATSSLGASEKEQLHRIVRQLADGGVAVIYVTHFLEEVFAVGHRVAVFKDGRLVAQHDVDKVDQETLIQQMVGRDASAFTSRNRRHSVGAPALELRNYRAGTVGPLSLTVRSGEVVGFGGLVGAGRTEVMEMLFGAVKPETGNLLLDGQDITPHSPTDALKHGLCMLTEDRQRLGILPELSVAQNITVARNERVGFWLRGETDVAEDLMNRLHVVAASPKQPIGGLSGGNQQKALLARWMAVPDLRILILDEPTKGVDIGAKNEIYRLVDALAESGCMILLVSSDLPELLSLADRIVVMRRGRVVGVLDASVCSEQSLMREFVGV